MAKNILSLTDEDKRYLMDSLGHRESDLWQIEQGFKQVKLHITDNDVVIGCKRWLCKQERAIKAIGRETFLSGLSRASFHATATRYSSDGRYEINFDLSHWWR